MVLQSHLDKEDLRIELSVAALHKKTRKAARQAADLEVTAGEALLRLHLFSSRADHQQ